METIDVTVPENLFDPPTTKGMTTTTASTTTKWLRRSEKSRKPVHYVDYSAKSMLSPGSRYKLIKTNRVRTLTASGDEQYVYMDQDRLDYDFDGRYDSMSYYSGRNYNYPSLEDYLQPV